MIFWFSWVCPSLQPLCNPRLGSGFVSILWIVLKMIFFLGVASLLGWWVFPRLSRLITSLPISQGLIAFTFVIILFYGWTAETIGQMAAITGAFLAGLWFGRTTEKERLHSGIATIAYGGLCTCVFYQHRFVCQCPRADEGLAHVGFGVGGGD